jgi:hypothetical protein
MRKEDKDIRRTNVRTWKCRRGRGILRVFFHFLFPYTGETARGFSYGDFSASFTHPADFTIADNIRISINAFRLLRGGNARIVRSLPKSTVGLILFVFENLRRRTARASRDYRSRRDLVAVNYSRWDRSSPRPFLFTPPIVSYPFRETCSRRTITIFR